MKRGLLFLISLLAILPFTFFVLSGSESATESFFEQEEEEGPVNPAWSEQILRMKGVYPSGWSQRMAEQSGMNKTSSGNLTPVIDGGPIHFGGRTRAMIVDVNNSAHYLAGAVSGGIWSSTNSGFSWFPVDDQAMTLSVTSLAQDLNSPNLIYYGTGETRGNSAGIPGMGVFRSTDGGQSFAQLPVTANKAFERVWQVKTDPLLAGILYVGTADSGLYKSVDSGATFSRVFMIGDKDVTDIEVFPNGSLMIAVRDTGIWKSTSGNAGSFTKVTGGLPATGFRRIEIAYCDSVPNVIYAEFEDGSLGTYDSGLLDIYRSSDAGQSWTVLPSPADPFGLDAAYNYPWYCFSLGVKPDDPNVVVSGCVEEVFSLDGGQTWELTPYTHSDHHLVLWDRANGNRFFSCNDGGIFRFELINGFLGSADDMNFDYRVTQFYAGYYFPAGLNAFGGAQDNGTYSMLNGPNNFNSIFGGDGSYCAINQQDPNIAYVSYQNGRIFRTINAQSSFPVFQNVANELDNNGNGSIDDGTWFINPFEINPLDGNQLYFVTQKRLWRTTDGANSWVKLTNDVSSSNQSPYCVGISRSATPTVYLGGEKGLLYRIDNALTAVPGNEVWLGASVPAGVQDDFIVCIEVSPATDSTIFVAFSNYSDSSRLWRVDGANTSSPVWKDISGNLPVGLPVNWIEVDSQQPNSFFIVATDLGLYTTTNGGQTWDKEMAVPNVSIHQLRLRESDRKLFIMTHGRGMWFADLPVIIGEPPLKAESLEVYPNPVRGPFQVRNGASREVAFDLVDGGGRLLKQGTIGTGASVGLDLSGEAAGIYFLVARSGESRVVSKIIKF
ncbi:MAG: T9SS type A sorting domain-containing protein [Bacteroidia bacterium]|nr:T9SS type A sorting domain-containing protein [Bacteroidia bacterium]